MENVLCYNTHKNVRNLTCATIQVLIDQYEAEKKRAQEADEPPKYDQGFVDLVRMVRKEKRRRADLEIRVIEIEGNDP